MEYLFPPHLSFLSLVPQLCQPAYLTVSDSLLISCTILLLLVLVLPRLILLLAPLRQDIFKTVNISLLPRLVLGEGGGALQELSEGGPLAMFVC